MKNARKTKEEIKRDLEDPILDAEIQENKELEEKATKFEKSEEAAAVIRKFQVL